MVFFVRSWNILLDVLPLFGWLLRTSGVLLNSSCAGISDVTTILDAAQKLPNVGQKLFFGRIPCFWNHFLSSWDFSWPDFCSACTLCCSNFFSLLLRPCNLCGAARSSIPREILFQPSRDLARFSSYGLWSLFIPHVGRGGGGGGVILPSLRSPQSFGGVDGARGGLVGPNSPRSQAIFAPHRQPVSLYPLLLLYYDGRGSYLKIYQMIFLKRDNINYVGESPKDVEDQLGSLIIV